MEPQVRFEWDEAKRRSNLWRHGIDFAELAEVFAGDPFTILDDRNDYSEERFATWGLLRGRVVVIVHTETETETEDVIRIISARWASKHEEIKYFKEIRN